MVIRVPMALSLSLSPSHTLSTFQDGFFQNLFFFVERKTMVLCGCGASQSILREEHRLKASENKAPTRIFGTKNAEITRR
jgi:hypothetical protein